MFHPSGHSLRLQPAVPLADLPPQNVNELIVHQGLDSAAEQGLAADDAAESPEVLRGSSGSPAAEEQPEACQALSRGQAEGGTVDVGAEPLPHAVLKTEQRGGSHSAEALRCPHGLPSGDKES